MCQRWWCGTPAQRKKNMKYCKVLSAAATVLTRSLAQNSVRLLTSVATILLLATNAFAGKPTAPAAPSNLAAAAVSSSEIDLTWKDNSTTEYGFKIQSAPTSGGTWTQIATVISVTGGYAGGGTASYSVAATSSRPSFLHSAKRSLTRAAHALVGEAKICPEIWRIRPKSV